MRVRAAVVAGLVAALAPVAPASASRLVRFTTTSKYVDPAHAGTSFNSTGHPNLPSPTKLPVNVLLPDGYDGKRTFPVLYLLHGHGDTYNSWVDPKHGDARRLIGARKMIVVMPEGGRGWYTNWWNGGRRGNPAWERYHLDELVPLVARKFRVRHGRRWHAIAGLSMGGEGAMFYAQQRPGYFGAVASFSPPLNIQRAEWPNGFDTQGEDHQKVFGDPDRQEFYWTGHNPTKLVRNLQFTRIFVGCGDGTPTRPDEASNYFGAVAERELRQQADDFVIAARDAFLTVRYDKRPGIHDWPYWRQYLRDALKWGFFQPVDVHPIGWTFETVSQVSRAWGFRFSFDKPPSGLVRFERAGRQFTGNGSGTVHIRVPGGTRVLTRKLPFAIEDLPRAAGTGG